MISTRAAMALLTAVPMDPEELSTCSRAGETFSRKRMAPSAASSLSLRATFLISETASLMRLMAGCDFQPKACRRKRARNSHLCGLAFAIVVLRSGQPQGALRLFAFALQLFAQLVLGREVEVIAASVDLMVVLGQCDLHHRVVVVGTEHDADRRRSDRLRG